MAEGGGEEGRVRVRAMKVRRVGGGRQKAHCN